MVIRVVSAPNRLARTSIITQELDHLLIVCHDEFCQGATVGPGAAVDKGVAKFKIHGCGGDHTYELHDVRPTAW
jgi:hypothetical protein